MKLCWKNSLVPGWMAGWIWVLISTGYAQGESAYEVILSATSTDGQTFTQDAGYRLTNGYVDAYVVKAETGNWLMLVSTTPATERLPQKIYTATSADGITWQVASNALITASGGGNALDPTAVSISNNRYRVYYSATASADPSESTYLTSGIMSTNEAGAWTFTADNVALGIEGVSAEARAFSNDAVRVYITAIGGMKVYYSTNGLASFTEETATLPQGSDPSILPLPDGRQRMYYVAVNQSGAREIWTALSSNWLDWTAETNTGIINTTGGPAWGVPDSFYDPAGNVQLFWVSMPTGAVSSIVVSDFDGDGLADPTGMDISGNWYIWMSGNGYKPGGPYELGVSGTPAPADFDGDGKADPAVMESSGNWYIWMSGSGYQRVGPYAFQMSEPVAGDYDGDGLADLADVDLFGNWYIWMSGSGYQMGGPYALGITGTPVAGDFDGDRFADPAVMDNTGGWHIWFSGSGYQPGGPYTLGQTGTPVAGDFDGDGLADPTVVDSSEDWYIWFSGSGYVMSGPHVLP